MRHWQTTAPKNKFQLNTHNTNQEAIAPPDEADRISYGEIVEVDAKNSQVKVKMYRESNRGGDFMVMNGAWLPVIQPLQVVHALYGVLRPGLKARIFWKGKHQPKTALIEIIGSETHSILSKLPDANQLDTMPYLSLTGGQIP